MILGLNLLRTKSFSIEWDTAAVEYLMKTVTDDGLRDRR